MTRAPDEHLLSAKLKDEPPDALLSLIGLFREDPRGGKIDLGVGVYRDASGITPVLRAVKAAERILLEEQSTKSYLGPEGDERFSTLLAGLAFTESIAANRRPVGVQTPGGTGALRVAAELIARTRLSPTVWIGDPTWPNHAPVIAAAGLPTRIFPSFDRNTQTLSFDQMMGALMQAARGDVVLLQACCHNPTGADLTFEQWQQLADLLTARGLVPLLDFAYHGLGQGLDEDAAGVRLVVQRTPETLVAYSCDKNFGLYRERTGALFVFSPNNRVVRANLLALARANWSMPPDHGAAVVRLILQSAAMTGLWQSELRAMQQRIAGIRARLAATDARLGFLGNQRGMFSLLPLDREQVVSLRVQHGIYMADSGRINIAGLAEQSVTAFAHAVQAAL